MKTMSYMHKKKLKRKLELDHLYNNKEKTKATLYFNHYLHFTNYNEDENRYARRALCYC